MESKKGSCTPWIQMTSWPRSSTPSGVIALVCQHLPSVTLVSKHTYRFAFFSFPFLFFFFPISFYFFFTSEKAPKGGGRQGEVRIPLWRCSVTKADIPHRTQSLLLAQVARQKLNLFPSLNLLLFRAGGCIEENTFRRSFQEAAQRRQQLMHLRYDGLTSCRCWLMTLYSPLSGSM